MSKEKKHKYILGYGFIIDNGLPFDNKGYEILYSETDTLASLKVDYSKELEKTSLEEAYGNGQDYSDETFNKLLYLMQDYDLANKVAKALIKKDVLNETVYECASINLLVWSESDDNSPFFTYKIDGKTYYEQGFCEFNCNDLDVFNK